MTNSKKYVGNETALPKLWDNMKAYIKAKNATISPDIYKSSEYLINHPERWVAGQEYDFGGIYGQKFTGTINGNAGQRVIIPLIALDSNTVLFAGGHVDVSDNNSYYFAGVNQDANKAPYNSNALWYDGTNLCLLAYANVSRSNASYLVWVLYTKSTDTIVTVPNTEMTVPAATAEAMLKPNMWKPDTEYSFGNGIYGIRGKGNISAAANEQKTISLGILGASQIIAFGGSWFDSIETIAIQESSSGSWESLVSLSSDGKGSILFKTVIDMARTNAPYDVWCLYTKSAEAEVQAYLDPTSVAQKDPVSMINKPNLWEPGKEYDFGDGVYGQRYIGTYKSNATKYQMTQIVLETTWSGYQIIQCGGGIQYEPNGVLQLGFSGNNQDGERNTFSTGLYGFRGSTLGVNVQIAQVNQTYSYDVWLLYTKTS